MVFVPMVAYCLMAVPSYTARGAIQVSEASGVLGANPLSELVGAGSQSQVQTEVEIIRRPEFLRDALQRLGLQVVAPGESHTVTMNWAVTFSGASPVDDRLKAVREAAEVARVAPDRFQPVRMRLHSVSATRLRVEILGAAPGPAETIDFSTGELVQHRWMTLKFAKSPLHSGQVLEIQLQPAGELLEAFERDIHVASLGSLSEPTNLVEISVTSTDRETARDIVQTMMERYLEKNLEWQSKSASQAAEFIEGQLAEVRRTLTEAESRLKEYSQRENAVQLDTQAKVAIENAAELEAQRLAIELQEKTISSVLGRIKAGGSAKASVTANFFEDPVLATSVQALTEAETKFEMMRASHTSEHPRVQESSRALALQKQEVAGLMRSAKKNLSHQKSQIRAKLDEANEAMKKYPDQQLELARLMREMGASERLYTLLLEKHEEAQIMKASTTTDKRIVDAASLPHKKSSPRRLRLLAFGVFGGLIFAIGCAFAAHLLQRKLETVEAVREAVPFPPYGSVPLVPDPPEGAERLMVKHLWEKPHEPAPEAFRALGVSVSLLPASGERGRVVMITSSQPGEGKSTVSANLGMALARSGKRTLVIDLDLRKPVLHRVWGVGRAPGYSDLVGQGGRAKDLDKLAHGGGEGTPTVLTAGTRLPDTVAAIMAPSLPKLLSEWLTEYDWVVIDSPPAFVAETAALAQHADLVLLVSRPGVIERANLRHATEALERVDVPLGLVLNAVGRQHTDYYYGSGYYYYNSSYGEDAAAAGHKRGRKAS
ncbi:MAG: P-loop NTPase [Myxococcales bacterium]|nr:P-loop NTPase [Myxococcales bacterium]